MKRKFESPREEIDDDYTSLDIASSTECTGMVPSPPLDEAEVEGYADIYSVPQKQAENAREMKVRGGKQVQK